MVTKQDIKDLRKFLNSKEKNNIPINIRNIVEELCEIYEMKYGL